MEPIGTRADVLGQGGRALQRRFEGPELAMHNLVAVPACIEQKLTHLSSLKDEAFAALRVVEEQLRDEVQARRETEAELERATAGLEAQRRRGYTRPTITAEELRYHHEIGGHVEIRSNAEPEWQSEHVEALTVRLARLTTNLERLRARKEELGQRVGACGSLLSRCEPWAQTHRHELVAAVARCDRHVGALPKAPAPDKLPAALDAIRKTIEDISTERQAVERAGVTVEEAKLRAVRYVDEQVAKWEPDARIFFNRNQALELFHFGGVVPPVSHVGFPGFAVRYCADQLKADLLASIDAEAARSNRGLLLSDADRDARLADLDTRLYEASVLEETLVLRLEEAERAVVRRGEAMPEAVLCTELAA